MTLHEVTAAYTALSKLITPTAWGTPLALPAIRAELMAYITDGDRPREVWEYPDPALDAAWRAVDACHLAMAQDDWRGTSHPHEVWALETCLAEETATLTFAKHHDSGTITTRSIASYGDVPADSLEAAQAILTQPAAPDLSEPVPVEEVQARMREALVERGIEGWDVVIDPSMAAEMSVLASARKVKVRADARITSTGLRQLLVHEIGTHVLRWHNASRQPTPVATLRPRPAMRTEEGFAVWNENAHGVNYPARDRTYAARVMGIHLSLHMGILDVLDELKLLVEPRRAVDIAIRSKRGMSNPHEAGAHVKDHVYLTGGREVGAHLSLHPTDEALLMSTKWPLNELWRVKELQSAGLVDTQKSFRPSPHHTTPQKLKEYPT